MGTGLVIDRAKSTLGPLFFIPSLVLLKALPNKHLSLFYR